MTRVGVVVGNPKAGSRTLAAARAVADAAVQVAELGETEDFVVDLAELGSRLFDFSDRSVRAVVDGLSACRLAVVASPTYKASYTGLLKAFLDWFSTTGLSQVIVVPVMVGAGPEHALAVDVHLRPVLVELGASLPTRGLYITENQLEDLDTVLARWTTLEGPKLRTALATARP
jgi:FMN reductase